MTNNDELDVLLRRIKRRRKSVDAFLKGTRPRHVRLINICIVSSALACLFMSGPGIGGQAFVGDVKQAFALEADQVWQPLCLLAALCSLVAAITANMSKSSNSEARIVSAEACASELEGLEALVEFRQVNLEQAVKLYQQYVAKIPFVADEVPSKERRKRTGSPGGGGPAR